MDNAAEKGKFGLLLICLAVILALRLVSLWFNNSELFFDEAQYWFWSTDLQFGYFSKPPTLAWVIAGATTLCGSNSEFCVRLAAPVFHVGTAICIYLTAARLFDERVGFWSGITWALLPAVSLSSTIISTDVPLLFFWSLALYAYVRLGEDFNLKWALLLGVALGLGINAKYAMAYFIGCAVIHMFVVQQQYTPPRRPGFWLAVVIAALLMIPNIWWNYTNDFVTASHTGDNIGWEGFNPNWSGLAEFFGSQFGVFGPILFGVYLATLFSKWDDEVADKYRLLLSFSLPVLCLILFQAVMSKAFANWAAATYVAATILVVEILVNRLPWAWMRANLVLHSVVFLAIAGAVCLAAPGQLTLPGGFEPFKRTQGSDLIAKATAEQLDAFEYNALVTTDRKLSALMHYKLRDREEAILAWRPPDHVLDHFQLVVPFQESLRDPVLLMSRYDNAKAYAEGFGKIIPLGFQEITAGEIERIYFFRLEDHESFQ